MTRIQKSALKTRLRTNLKFHKKELRKLVSMGSRLHLRSDRYFKAAFFDVKKGIRLFQRLNAKIK